MYGAPEDVDLASSSEDGYLYTYDVDFPPHTLLGRYDFRSCGADQAGVLLLACEESLTPR